MHPRVLAEEMAKADARIEVAARELAGRDLPPVPHARDPMVRELYRKQQVAELFEELAGRGEGGASPRDIAGSLTTADLLAARIAELPRLSEAQRRAIVAEVGRESPRPLSERLEALEGVGARIAEQVAAIVEEIG